MGKEEAEKYLNFFLNELLPLVKKSPKVEAELICEINDTEVRDYKKEEQA